MISFIWNRKFETGIDEVDQQHRHLVDLINRYGDHLASNDVNSDEIETLLGDLVSYTEYHFREEEGIMAEVGVDPRYVDEHVSKHHEFIKEVNAIRDSITVDTAEYLLDFLIHWLAHHILGSDQNLARQIARIKAGIAPECAYEMEVRESSSATEPLLMALHRLFEQVSDRNRQLLELNESLERKVAERTRELAIANEHLEQLSLTDALTGLPNRRHAMRQLKALWDEAAELKLPIACMMIDADHFKEVNDAYGHDAGDAVLIELARTLKHGFRNDDVVCRLGGDEFFVICPNTDLNGGLHIAECVRKDVASRRCVSRPAARLGAAVSASA